MSVKIPSAARGVMADTIPVRIDPMDRQLLNSVAQFKGLKLSTWLRTAAIERSRDELEQRLRASNNTAEGS